MGFYMKLFFAITILFFSFSFALAQHEYSPIKEYEIKYKNWIYKTVTDGKDVDLREFAKNKKLVMVVYFAAWCGNWKNQAPFTQKLYDKYKDKGFDVIGVSEYASIADTKQNLTDKKITFTVVAESDSKASKQTTPHYEYRQKTGDTRSWGSPWNIFIEQANYKKKGDEIVKKAFVVNGELIEAEVEAFIRKKLGLPAEEPKGIAKDDKKIEVCSDDVITLKKP
jgi:peroxiredoxin